MAGSQPRRRLHDAHPQPGKPLQHAPADDGAHGRHARPGVAQAVLQEPRPLQVEGARPVGRPRRAPVGQDRQLQVLRRGIDGVQPLVVQEHVVGALRRKVDAHHVGVRLRPVPDLLHRGPGVPHVGHQCPLEPVRRLRAEIAHPAVVRPVQPVLKGSVPQRAVARHMRGIEHVHVDVRHVHVLDSHRRVPARLPANHGQLAPVRPPKVGASARGVQDELPPHQAEGVRVPQRVVRQHRRHHRPPAGRDGTPATLAYVLLDCPLETIELLPVLRVHVVPVHLVRALHDVRVHVDDRPPVPRHVSSCTHSARIAAVTPGSHRCLLAGPLPLIPGRPVSTAATIGHPRNSRQPIPARQHLCFFSPCYPSGPVL